MAALLLTSPIVCGQTMLLASNNIAVPGFSPPVAAVIKPVIQPCARPAEIFDLDDYSGPLHQLVSGFSATLERKTVQPARRRQCSLTAGEKFHLFVKNTSDPINFLDAGWDAGWGHLDKDDAAFGEGARGFGRRYAAALADNVSGEFFNTFLYPAVFRQDPRYYRLGAGPFHQRLFHAVRHVFVAHSDSGHLMFNYSEWMGTASSKAISNLYHPGNERGFGTTAQRTGFSITTDMGFDVLREFWPEITRRFHLPFKANSN